MKLLNEAQYERLSEFFCNISVAWFIAGFIGAADFSSVLKYGLNGLASLVVSLMLAREVKRNDH